MATQTETLTSPRTGARTRSPRGTDDRWGILFTAPFFVLYILFLLWPVLAALRTSFYNDSLGGESSWAGFGNYSELLGDSNFWQSMWHTLWFTILTVPPLVVIALALALMVSRLGRGQWLYRIAFFAPFVLPVSVVVLVFNWLYQPSFGLINSYLTQLGLSEVNWLGDANVAMISAAIATVWWTVGFNFVLYLSALQEIPRELYEAAAVDGATPWQQIRRITIPMLVPTTMLVLVLQVIASLKIFDQVYLLQSGGPGPEDSTRVAIQYIYESGFTSYRVGYASALSFVFFLAVVLVSLLLFAALRRVGRTEGRPA
jgi:multiple sugar transport system permease protein